MVKKKTKQPSLKTLLKNIDQLEKTVSSLETSVKTDINNHEQELRKLREIMKKEEAGFLNRLTSLESQLADSYIDQERLQSVINTLGQTIQNQQRTLRNRTRFRSQEIARNYEAVAPENRKDY